MDDRDPNTRGGSDTGNTSEKPKLRQITSIEELTAYVEEILPVAVSNLTDPIRREMQEGFVDVPMSHVLIDADINIPGMSREEAMEAVFTAFFGGRDIVQKSDAADNVYVAQYTRDVAAIILSKVLETAELIRLADGSIAIAREGLSQIPGSTLSVVGEKSDKLFTEADLGLVLKKVLLGGETTRERDLEKLRSSTNKPPIILLTCWFRDVFGGIDQPNLEFLCNTGIGLVFRIKEGSKHFLFQTNKSDSAVLKGLRLEQHRKIDDVLK